MKFGNHGSAPRGGIIDYHGDEYARSRRRGSRAGGGGGGDGAPNPVKSVRASPLIVNRTDLDLQCNWTPI